MIDVLVVRRAVNGGAHVGHHLDIAVRHEKDLACGLFAGDLRRLLHSLVEIGETRLFAFGLRRNQPGHKAGKVPHEREEKKRRDNVEPGMHGGHGCGGGRRPVREQGLGHRKHHGNEERYQHDRPDNIEEGMRHGGSLGLRGASERRKPGGDRGSDVHAEHGGGGSLKRNDPLHRKRHGDRRGCGGTLHHRGENDRHSKALEKTNDRACVQRRKRSPNGLVLLERRDAFVHPVKAHEHKSKTHESQAEIVGGFPVYEEIEYRAQRNDGKPQKPDIWDERYDPRRCRRTDVRTDDHIYRLRQIQETRRHKPDGDYRNDRTRLHNDRGNASGGDSGEPVGGGKRHETPESTAAYGLKAFGQMFHAKQKGAETTRNRQKNDKHVFHNCR